MRPSRILALFVFSLLLHGCGGGGDAMDQAVAGSNELAAAIEKKDITAVKAAIAKIKEAQKKLKEMKDKLPSEDKMKKYLSDRLTAEAKVAEAQKKVATDEKFVKELGEAMKDADK
jgi:hypothetical protein